MKILTCAKTLKPAKPVRFDFVEVQALKIDDLPIVSEDLIVQVTGEDEDFYTGLVVGGGMAHLKFLEPVGVHKDRILKIYNHGQ